MNVIIIKSPKKALRTSTVVKRVVLSLFTALLITAFGLIALV